MNPPDRIGLALSGGGARAMAFHLGVLRALHRLSVLHRVRVVSAVSGGAVLGALYAYSSDSFEEFDARVVALLRDGLQVPITRKFFFSKRLIQAASTWPVVHATAGALAVARFGIGLFPRGRNRSRAQPHPWLRHVPDPPVRRVSRTDAFEDVLRERLFGDIGLDAPRRGGIDVVLNATELCTGTAFRFGSRGCSCWRYGTVVNPTPSVAMAVTASAAYPLLLPALDRTFEFEKERARHRHRVVLTDGGVYENLGVSPLLPGRDHAFSPHAYDLDGIVCARAGEGQWSGDALPIGWMSRMATSFLATHRKAEDGVVKLLHHLIDAGRVRGLLPALGQDDDALMRALTRCPSLPPLAGDYVRREAVVRYPTDFRAVPEVDLALLTARGEQQTTLLAKLYWT